ncbi:solute carrier family 15 member 4-like [Lineus longissimus]|uniref:solute carrier family 15 member 4-like n=1 Tax=Lineus longissimus TaxID=88925 RepID=UPI00315C51DB
MNTSHGTLDGDAEVDELTACLPRRRSTNRVGLGVVLALDTLEGLTVYTIVSSVVLFCEDNLSLSKTEAVVVYLIFGAIMFIVPCITGALGDAVVTRYTCILASLAVFLLGGLVMLSLALIMSQDMDFRPRRALYMVSLVLVGVGSGGCISVSIPFGADQLADPSPRNMWSFFIWKHWFYCLGKFLGYLPLPDVLKAVDKDTHKETVLLPQAIIVVVAVGLGIGILLLGKPRFNIVQPQGKKIFSRLKNGFSMCLPCLCRESFDYVSLGSSTSLTDERRDNRLLLKRVILLSALFSLFGIYTIFHYQLSSTFMLQAEELQNASPLPVISLNMC